MGSSGHGDIWRKTEGLDRRPSRPAAAKDIRAEIEAREGIVYTDYTEYLSQDCHSPLLCAAVPDGMFFIVRTYPGLDGRGCGLSVYSGSETVSPLLRLIGTTFSMERPTEGEKKENARKMEPLEASAANDLF